MQTSNVSKSFNSTANAAVQHANRIKKKAAYRSPRRFRRQIMRGFTLIELLIVMAIIALLMGLLLPALATARERSNSVKCLSNMRQISIAATAWSADNNGKILPAVTWDTATSTGEGWAHLLVRKQYIAAPLYKDGVASTDPDFAPLSLDYNSALICPNNTDAVGGSAGSGGLRTSSNQKGYAPQSFNGTTVRVGYGINSGAIGADSGGAIFPSLEQGALTTTQRYNNLSEVVNVGKTVFIYDGYDQHNNSPDQNISSRHRGGQAFNVAFLDGHVEEVQDDAFTAALGTATDLTTVKNPVKFIKN